jgi:signal transduction histidine kinase
MLSPPLTRKFLLATLVTGLGFFILGSGAMLLMPRANSAAVIWPATAFAACMIVRQGRGRVQRAIMLGTVLVADLFNNALNGDSAAIVIVFTAINIAELALAVTIVARGRRLSLRPPSAVQDARLTLMAALLPPAAGGACAMAASWLMDLPQPAVTGLHWFIADVLGFLMLFPIGMRITWRQIAKLELGRRWPLALAALAMLAACAIGVFRLGDPSLKFLVLAAALFVARWFRLMGAGTGLAVIAAAALSGPMPPVRHDAVTEIQVLQFFLVVCSVLCVRTAMLMNERDLHVALIERRRRQAVRASRFKSRLLAHVSHEVRNPLSAIIGFSGLLEQGNLPAERAPEFAAIIAHNGELLQRLHDDLLDLSRAEAGALAIRPERVAVGSTLAACVKAIRLEESLGGKTVLLETVEDRLAVMADPVRLAQILNNLIANAYKYGDNASPITLRARALEDGFGRIEVVNGGPGIPTSERDAVFLPFRRSDAVGRSVPGAGLGLSIAKMLVEAQGGRIDFESVPGRQTRFWIDLPLVA